MAKFCANCGAPLQDNEKFCGKCGAKVEDLQPAGQASASNGGFSQAQQNIQQAEQNIQQTQQSYNQPAGSPVPQPAAPKGPNPAAVWVKGHIPLLAILLIGILVIVAGIIILINVFKYQVIDPKDIAAVEFTGPDGVASVAVTLNDATVMKSYYLEQSSKSKSVFDYDFYKKNIKKLTADDCSDYFNTELKTEKMLDVWTKADDKSDAKRMMNALLKMKDGEYVIKFEPDKTEGLKNGDKIKIKVDYDEEYLKEKNIKLSSDEFEVEVKELKKGEKLDMFKDVSLDCSNGYNGSAVTYDGENYGNESNVITIKKGDAKEFVNYSFNEFSEDDDYSGDYGEDSDEKVTTYSNGDKIKVYAQLKSNLDSIHETKSGTYFTNDSKYYIVSKKSDSKELEVKGLKDAQELDIFSNVTFTTDGYAPELSIDNGWGNNGSLPEGTDYAYCVTYRVKPAEDLAIGDKFTAYAKVDTAAVEKLGYSITNEANATAEDFGDDGYDDDDNRYSYYSKEITIDETFGHYITTKEDAISAESNLKDYDDYNAFDERVTYVKDDINEWNNVSVTKSLKEDSDKIYIEDITKITGFTYVGSCISYSKTAVDGHQSYVVKIYKTTVLDKKKKSHTFYTAIVANNVYKNSDGVIGGDSMSSDYYLSPSLIYKDYATNDESKPMTVVKYNNSGAQQ